MCRSHFKNHHPIQRLNKRLNFQSSQKNLKNLSVLDIRSTIKIIQFPNENSRRSTLRLRKSFKDFPRLAGCSFHRQQLPLIHGLPIHQETVSLVCFVRNHGSTAKAVSSPWRPVSGVLEQHATGTVHHLGNEHRRAGAESAISLLILVLVVLAVEITALWNKHVFFFFHRRTIDRNKFFTIFKILKHNGIKENFSFKFYPLFYYAPTIFVSER